MSFLMGNKLWLGIIAGLIGIGIGLFIEAIFLKSQISALEKSTDELRNSLITEITKNQISMANLNECNSKLTTQNTKLDQISIDNKSLQDRHKKLKTELEKANKQLQAPLDNKDCKQTLKYYETQLKRLSR